MKIRSSSTQSQTQCYHCGEQCQADVIVVNDKAFCCQGCKLVYEIINESGLCEYYDLEKNPGISQKFEVREGKFAFLENREITEKLVHFKHEGQEHVTFYLPQMHCSSCIWLLEQLPKLRPGIIKSTVNFLKKEVTVIYNTEKVQLRGIAELLTRVGYEPHISLHDIDPSRVRKYDRSRIYKIGVAGFCFGNIMLLSFPDYFASGDIAEQQLKNIFSFLNLALAIPVFFYCASDFFISAYKGFRQKFLNIDAPIALAVLIAFIRSVYEITTFSGAGYLDSMSGIVFFMLIGRFFQDKTYQSLTFDRDYTSYFPLGVTVIRKNKIEEQVSVADLKKGDRIRIHSHEIIPADGILFLGKANIDYSFVTGESVPSEVSMGEIIYAGGKQVGAAIELEVVKEVSQSYLTQLWNNEVFGKNDQQKHVSFVHRLSRYFTYILFSIAITTAAYWSINDPSKTWDAVTAILIVACPCALLLSSTFTNGNMMSRLQSQKFYIKNSNVLEGISKADTIVFDKTGTISMQGGAVIRFENGALSPYEQQLVRSLVNQSNHPLAKMVSSQLPYQPDLPLTDFMEEKGIGGTGVVDRQQIMIGSEEYVTGKRSESASRGTRVYVSINGELLGNFLISAAYRTGLEELIPKLQKNYFLAVLSGDNSSEEKNLRKIFGEFTEMRFHQDPHDKLEYIRNLQSEGKRVIMLGDGLNDAGALQQSDAGIAITDDINNFSPGCDAILDGRQFNRLDRLLKYCRQEKKIIYGSFIISILYNIVGLGYAVQAELSPVIAAILMPVSSISIVAYTTLISAWFARHIK